MAQIAGGGLHRDKAAFDLHQSIGQGFIVPAGEAGEDQLARNARRRAGNDDGASLELLDMGKGKPKRDRTRYRLGSTIAEMFQ